MTNDAPLLATKLHAPVLRPGAVRRQRLIDRLMRPGRLVLVAAPAGFGKTSVLTEWLAARSGGRVAWLSLDERDDDASQFWRYLLAAVDAARGADSAAASRTTISWKPPRSPRSSRARR